MPLFNFGANKVETLKQKKDVAGLCKLAANENHSPSRLEAIQALGELKDDAAIRTLHILCTSYNSNEVEISTAIKALCQIGSSDAAEKLIVMVIQGKPKHAAEARQALLSMGDPAVLPLVEMMNNNKNSDSLTAAELLTKIGSPFALRSVELAQPHLAAISLRIQENSHKASFANKPINLQNIVSDVLSDRLKELAGEAGVCKAYQNGRCVVRGQDSGKCTWDPTRWRQCAVVINNNAFYGDW
jgi:hypothetical protein